LVTAEAKPLLQGTFAGTLNYMAPEQLRGSMVDGRTDIFALGPVLYEMLAGRRPLESETTANVITAILHADPPPLALLPSRDVPPPLEHLIRTCLAKDPDDRWQSARDVQRELSFIGHGSTAAGVTRAKIKLQRWRWGLMLAMTIAAALTIPWMLQSTSAPTAVPAPRVRFNVQPIGPATLLIDQTEARVSLTDVTWHSLLVRGTRLRSGSARLTPWWRAKLGPPTAPRSPSGRPTVDRLASTPTAR
jgi:serine/threonine protein kinase